jgi:Aspartyl/Asparaginyl beta-hydroxylase
MNEGFAHLYPWQIVTRLAGLDLTCRINGHRPLDVNRLKAEVEGILAEYAPATHSSDDLYHDGGWSAVGLIAHNGNPFEDRARPPYKKTAALARAPYIASLIDGFATEPQRVRLMGLQPRKSIFWHYDRGETIDNARSVRLHLPIFTNRSVRFRSPMRTCTGTRARSGTATSRSRTGSTTAASGCASIWSWTFW